MPEATTERLGLIKPFRDTNTPLDIERLNLNSDVLDRATGAANVADGVIPPTVELYDGKIVREKGTGAIWVAEKQTNGSFAKKWLKYPYLFVAATPKAQFGVGDTWWNYGWSTWWPGSYNAPASDLAPGGFWKVPFKGIFNMRYNSLWGATTSVGQYRADVFTADGVQDTLNTQSLHISVAGAASVEQANSCSWTRMLDPGTVIGHQVYQGGGFAATLYSSCEMTCIERLD